MVFCGASRRSSRGDTCHALLPGSVDFGTSCGNASGTYCRFVWNSSPLPWLYAKHALVPELLLLMCLWLGDTN